MSSSINNKRKYGETEEEERPTSFKDLPFHLLTEYLEPLDLLACMYLNKTTRKVTARALNEHKYDPKAATQQMMFDEWLDNPSVSDGNLVFEEEMSPGSKEAKNNPAGPLRLPVIKHLNKQVKKNFVILGYNRTYKNEKSVVAIFNDNGVLVAIYKLNSHQYYEGYANKNVMTGGHRVFNSRGGTNYGTAWIDIENSGEFSSLSGADAC